MIIIKFDGGLGNQMYEYNFYQYIKQLFPNELVKIDLDRYIYDKYKVHQGFELCKLFENITFMQASTKEIINGGGIYERHTKCIFDVIKKITINCINNIKEQVCPRGRFFEKDISADIRQIIADALEERECIWLSGFWCTPPQIFFNFTFKDLLDEKNKKIQEEIRRSNSVSIHIRRGDYVTYGITTVDLDWYTRAMKRIEDLLNICSNDIVYFVFSDDKEYVNRVFDNKKNIVVVRNNEGAESFKDMVLISSCQHNIICNSTFSEWGAILNSNLNKIVIYPSIIGKKYSAFDGTWIEMK